MHRVECDAIIKHFKYYWWCLFDLWDNWRNPPCPECGVKKVK